MELALSCYATSWHRQVCDATFSHNAASRSGIMNSVRHSGRAARPRVKLASRCPHRVAMLYQEQVSFALNRNATC